MAYGELVQIEQKSCLTSAATLDCVALVEVFCRFLILNVFIIFRFLILNAVEVSDQPFQVILKRVIHFIDAKCLQRLRAVARITFECVARGDVQLVN